MESLANDFAAQNTLYEEDDDAAHNSTNRLEALISQIDNPALGHVLHVEVRKMIYDHQKRVSRYQQRVEELEDESGTLRNIVNESQRRYEKAVREMQFFKKRYDRLAETTQTENVNNNNNKNQQYTNGAVSHLQTYGNLTPSNSPKPKSITEIDSSSSVHSYELDVGQKSPSNYQYWSPPASVMSEGSIPATRRRNDSNATATASIFSAFSNSTDSTSVYSHREDKKPHTYARNPSMVSSLSSSSGASFTTSNNTPLPTRQQANSNTSANMILQRRTDPLTYGGSDALWDAIAKSKGSDAVIEKIISNFIRRGGSPNTAKQSSTTLPIKYGYGMIHAVIVNKASNALDLLLQNGANPNIMSMCQLETDKVSPCYLACSVGWLAGLEKLVEVGGDLLFSRGEGNKKKTCLHVAAEYGYAEITEYLVNMTQGVLNLQTDNEGANILHYACLSGHTEIVGFIIRVCGVSPHDSDNKGELPIHWATRKGHVEVVLSLVERFNSDINSYISKKVPTPYDLAKSNGHKRLAELIKSRGGLAAKKLDKRREDEMANQVPSHLEAALSKNGLLGGF